MPAMEMREPGGCVLVHAMLEMEEKLVLACGHMCAVCCHLLEQGDVVFHQPGHR